MLPCAFNLNLNLHLSEIPVPEAKTKLLWFHEKLGYLPCTSHFRNIKQMPHSQKQFSNEQCSLMWKYFLPLCTDISAWNKWVWVNAINEHLGQLDKTIFYSIHGATALSGPWLTKPHSTHKICNSPWWFTFTFSNLWHTVFTPH
jgi:hypothetical protein